jgi:hypothetical protein
MATIDIPFNPNLTPEHVYDAVSSGFSATAEIKKPPSIPGAANVIVRRGHVQAAVKLHQRDDRTYLVVNSQPGIVPMLLGAIIFGYLFTAGSRRVLENEVIDYLRRWLVPAEAPTAGA